MIPIQYYCTVQLCICMQFWKTSQGVLLWTQALFYLAVGGLWLL